MTRSALFVQALRGPLVLILLGSLFAMHQAGVADFKRTWPLLIILIGIAKLVERLLMAPGAPAGVYTPGAYPPPPPPPPPGAPRV